MRNLIVFLILLQVHIGVGGENFPDEIWNYIKGTICKYGNQNPHIIEPYVTDQWQRNMTEPKLWQYLVPRLLLWDPLNQYPLLLENTISCPEHNSLLIAGNWRAKLSMQPRWIYDKGGAILLVMRTYVCKHSNSKPHSYLSGEATITEQLPQCLDVPFQLSHKAGFTETLERDIVERIMAGVNFWHIENQIRSTAVHQYALIQKRYCLDVSAWNCQIRKVFNHHFHPEQIPEYDSYSKCYSPVPSDSYLKDIFMNHHNINKIEYEESFTNLKGTILSCDHTFKVSVNVGFINPTTKQWTTQYDSLFMVLNEFGQVLRFQLVKSTAFSNIEHLLTDYKDSSDNNATDVELIMLDNCCSWKKKIMTIFPQALVKLDLFHAVQRITKHIPMKSEHRKQILAELRLVFRQIDDVKKERKSKTPESHIILENLNSFSKKWENVLSNEALKAVNNLKQHIQKGCLSNIPPGAGTNRNEKLHHFLNHSALAIGRIGVELAKAILCILLYAWNCSKDTLKKNMIFPIFSNFHKGKISSMCCFAIANEMNERFNNNEEKCLKLPETNTSTSDNLDQLEDQIMQSTCTFSKLVTLKDMSLHTCNFDASLWALDHKPFLLRNSFHEISQNKILLQNLAKLDMDLVETVADGNCLFHAIAYSLINSQEKHKLIGQIDLDLNNPLNLAFHLRQATVFEISQNQNFYKTFCTEEDLFTIEDYKRDGKFEGNMGDLLVTAASNMLSIPIIIVTARSDIDVIFIETSKQPLTEHPIVVAYDHSGPGHYSAVSSNFQQNLLPDTTDVPPIQTNLNDDVKKSCRCGRSNAKSSNEGKVFCIKSRCPCFKLKISCNSMCDCISCQNPHGKKEQKIRIHNGGALPRIRRKKHVSFKQQPGHKFLETCKEKLSHGTWTKSETFLLYKILKSTTKRNKRPPTATTSTVIYNKIVETILTSDPEIPTRLKTIKQIQYKQAHMIKTENDLSKLFQI